MHKRIRNRLRLVNSYIPPLPAGARDMGGGVCELTERKSTGVDVLQLVQRGDCEGADAEKLAVGGWR